MPKQIIPVTGLSEAGLIADMPPVTLPPNAFSDCNNVRFRNGAVSKVQGAIDIMPFVRLGSNDILKYVAWWPNPNLARFNMGYYLLIVQQGTNDNAYLLKVDELGDAENLVYLEPLPEAGFKGSFTTGGNWQHTFFQGGFALIINNGLEAPRYVLDDLDNVISTDIDAFEPLPFWASYAVDSVEVGTVTAGVIRSFGDFLIAGNLVERQMDGTVIRALPGVIRTSDIAAPGGIPQNWNPFETGANTADEFTLTADGVVQDLVELQGKMFAYSNSSISSISRTGNPAGPFSVATVTPVYGALTTDSVIEFDGRHFVVGAQDIYIFGGHPGSIQSIGDARVRDYFYNDLNLVDLAQLFVLRYQQEDEIWICYPSQSAIQGRANKALVFNYRHNTWSKRDIPGVFNGVIGPVPGGGLPMASLGFDGEAKISSVTEGAEHEISIDNLADIPMQGDGRPYIEVLDLSDIDVTETGGDPSIRVVLNEDFFTGNENPLRFIARATPVGDDSDPYTEIYTLLPDNLGSFPGSDVEYNTTDYRNEVLQPIISKLREEQAAIDGIITITNVTDEGLANRSFDITFNSANIPSPNFVTSVNIINNVNIDYEINLLNPEDRPQTGGAQDTTVDRIGHNIGKDEKPEVLALYPENTVFEFDFTDIWDRLDDLVFFGKGERIGFLNYNNRFEDIIDNPIYEDISAIVAGVLKAGDTEAELDGNDPDDSMDGGTYGGDAVDGDARVNSDFTGGILFDGPNLLGSRIKELIEMSPIEGNRRLDLLLSKDDIPHFNLIAYMIPKDSDGNPDYDYVVANAGILKLNFWNGRFDKDANAWIKDTKVEPISVILSSTATNSVSQNTIFCESIANTLTTTGLFSATATGQTVEIKSIVNGAYILEWDIENLFYADETAVPSTDISSVESLFQQGIPNFRNTAGTLVAPCIHIRYTDPDGIDFFSFDTGLIDLRGNGNSVLTVAEQREIIDKRIQEVAPGQWRLRGDVWSTNNVIYNEANGDTGVPYPESDGTYNFPSERNGSNWTIEYSEWTRPVASGTLYPSASISKQGNYETVTPGSYLAILLSNNVVYTMPVTGSNIAESLAVEIKARVPQLDVVLTDSNQGLSIQPGVLGDDTVFIIEAHFNTTDTIEDFNRLMNGYEQDSLNVAFVASLPDAVLSSEVVEFPSVDNGPVIVDSVVTTEFDVDRTWSSDQVDLSYEFPIFSGGEEFPIGSTTNAVVAAEIGWSYPSYSLAGTSYLSYESFVERKQMAMSPEFDTEQLQSVALWADGSTPVQFQGDSRYNVLEFSAATTDNPGQSTDLSNSQQANTFYISENYKMDIRLTGRFLNWRLSDSVSGPLESPGDKTFSQQTEWNLSGMQLSVRTGGSR